MESDGLAGIAATVDFVFVAGRDLADKQDVFRCLAAEDGSEVWTIRYTATGNLDYGNSPRATPLIHGDHVFFQGAFGDLNCVLIDTGEVVWKRHFSNDFEAKPATWGACSSPLVVDDKLIVNPGGSQASLVALKPATGEVIWKTPGRAAGYGSLNVATFGGITQIVGHDDETLGGWDAKTGKRLWTLKPPRRGDFNVPTPIPVGDTLFVVTENNGSRLYQFDQQGRIVPEPIAHNEDLAPDTSTPVVVNDLVVGCWSDLWCLDVKQQLKSLASLESDGFHGHVNLIAGPGKVLTTGHNGELSLLSVANKQVKLLSHQKPFSGDIDLLSHPALVGSKLFLRVANRIQCLELGVAT